MLAPNYITAHSLIDNKVQVHGNIEFASWLSDFVKEKCIKHCNLYEAQEIVREYCISTYCEDFYEKNAEAINFIVENEYCHKERNRFPIFDKRQYEEDMRSGILY